VKKNNTAKRELKRNTKAAQELITIGLDLGDKVSRYCLLNSS
jgi:hypothetical protein